MRIDSQMIPLLLTGTSMVACGLVDMGLLALMWTVRHTGLAMKPEIGLRVRGMQRGMVFCERALSWLILFMLTVLML